MKTMIPSYYINLARAEERRGHIKKLARDAEISLIRIDAVDGQDLSDETYDAVHPPSVRERRMTKSEVSCFLSHRKAWELIVNGKESHGAIFEDDIYFGRSLGPLLNDSSWIGPDMDIVKLDKGTRRRMELGGVATRIHDIEIRELHSLHVATGGYILSRRCAEGLLAETRILYVPVDHAIFDEAHSVIPEARIYQAVPALCIQQQTAAERFLPKQAEVSLIEAERKKSVKTHAKPKKSGVYLVKKIFREITRPLARAGLLLWKKTTCALRGTQWTRISFTK